MIGVPRRCKPPKIKLDIVMNRKSLDIIALKPKRKTLSSKIGAKMTADINVNIGKTLNSFLMVVSFVDIPPPNILISILIPIGIAMLLRKIKLNFILGEKKNIT